MNTHHQLPIAANDHWQKGQKALLENKEVEALSFFKKNLQILKNLSWDQLSQISLESWMIICNSLERAGWINKKNDEFEKAYFYYNIRFEYAQKFVSARVAHSSCLDLDSVCIGLGDQALSSFWLHKSLQMAADITNPIDQNQSLARSYDRLSAAYANRHDYEKSLQMLDLSLDHWLSYESFCGSEENRVFDSYLSLGDLFLQWSIFLRSSNQNYKWTCEQSEKNYRKAFEIGVSRNIDGHKMVQLKEKLDQHNNFNLQTQSI